MPDYLRLASKDGIKEPQSLKQLAARVLDQESVEDIHGNTRSLQGREVLISRRTGLEWVAQRFCDQYMPGPDGPDAARAIANLAALLRAAHEQGYQEGLYVTWEE